MSDVILKSIFPVSKTVRTRTGAVNTVIGLQGATGATGATGAAGPNLVSSTTGTDLTGYLKGNGSTVTAVTPIPAADIDSAIARDSEVTAAIDALDAAIDAALALKADLVTGKVPSSQLPIASTGALGAVRVGSNLTIDGDGILSGVAAVSSAALDAAFGSTRGSILRRGASGWELLTPGTNGQYLQTAGAGADPIWSTVNGMAIGGTVTSGTAGRVLYVGAGPVLANSDGFHYDETNNRFGIGTSGSPNARLDVRTTSGGNATVENVPMTSANTPSPYVAAASTEINASNAAYLAFDNSDVTKWSASTSTGWLRYDFGTARTLTAYRVKGAVSGETTYAPKDFTLEGSSDASSWTAVDTQTNQTGWTALESRSFTLSSPATYRYFRLNVSANNGGALVSVVQLDLLSSGTAAFVVHSNDVNFLNGAMYFFATSAVFANGYKFMTGGTRIYLSQTGGSYGTSIGPYNASAGGGAIIRSEGGGSAGLTGFVDLIFSADPADALTRPIRMESRGGQLAAGNSSEFQIGALGFSSCWVNIGNNAMNLRVKLATNQTAAATTLGSVTRRFPVYDESGNLLGYMPIYDSIT